jgi:hypothetical protein
MGDWLNRHQGRISMSLILQGGDDQQRPWYLQIGFWLWWMTCTGNPQYTIST